MQLKQLAEEETLDNVLGFILNRRGEENCLIWKFCWCSFVCRSNLWRPSIWAGLKWVCRFLSFPSGILVLLYCLMEKILECISGKCWGWHELCFELRCIGGGELKDCWPPMWCRICVAYVTWHHSRATDCLKNIRSNGKVGVPGRLYHLSV